MNYKLTSALLAVMLTPCLAQVSPPAEDHSAVPPQGFDQAREGIEKGKAERVEYDGTAVAPDLKRWMQVYTPPGYSKDKKYPVLYLIHGARSEEHTSELQS